MGMDRLVAIRASDPELVPLFLRHIERDLRPPRETDPLHIWGLGYYAEGRPLLTKKPVARKDVWDLELLGRSARSAVVVAQLSEMRSHPDTAPPAAFRRWLMTTPEPWSAYAGVAEALLRGAPAFVRAKVDAKAESTASLVLGATLGELERRGWISDALISAKTWGQVLELLANVAKELALEGEGPAPFGAFVLSNGEEMVVRASNDSFAVRSFQGLEASARDTGDLEEHVLDRFTAALRRFRGTCVVSKDWLRTGAPEWSTVDPQSHLLLPEGLKPLED